MKVKYFEVRSLKSEFEKDINKFCKKQGRTIFNLNFSFDLESVFIEYEDEGGIE